MKPFTLTLGFVCFLVVSGFAQKMNFDLSDNKWVGQDLAAGAPGGVYTCGPRKVKKEIVFTSEVTYELYDSYGQFVQKGLATSIDVSGLHKGIYYICFDNKAEKFIKK